MKDSQLWGTLHHALLLLRCLLAVRPGSVVVVPHGGILGPEP